MQVNACFILLPLNLSCYSLFLSAARAGLLLWALQLCPVGPDASIANHQALHSAQELLLLRAHCQQPADSFSHADLKVDLLLGVTFLKMQKNKGLN